MAKIETKDLKTIPNKGAVAGDFLVVQASVGGNDSRKWINLTLSNGDINFPCKKWNYQEGEFMPEIGSVVHLMGIRNDYNGAFSLNANLLSPSQESVAEFKVMGPTSLADLKTRLESYLAKVTNPVFQKIINAVGEEFATAIPVCPAAVGHHHAYDTGWLQHTAEVVEIAYTTGQLFTVLEGVTIDLEECIAGAYVHDLGKLVTYYMENSVVPSCTPMEGSIGHIVVGLQVLESLRLKYFPEVPYSDPNYQRIVHDVASHQENLEWGSPAKPNSFEALLIARADNLSAGVAGMKNELAQQSGEWGVKRSYEFGTYLHKRIE